MQQKECKLQPKSMVQTLAPEYLWVSRLSSVNLNFLICKLKMRMPASGGGCGNQSSYLQSPDRAPATE